MRLVASQIGASKTHPTQLATDYAGRAKIVKVEMHKNQHTAMAWRVRAAPALLQFKGGAVHATHVSMASKAQLAKPVDAAP